MASRHWKTVNDCNVELTRITRITRDENSAQTRGDQRALDALWQRRQQVIAAKRAAVLAAEAEESA